MTALAPLDVGVTGGQGRVGLYLAVELCSNRA